MNPINVFNFVRGLAGVLTGPPADDTPIYRQPEQGPAGRELEDLLEPDEGWECWWHSKDDDPAKLAADRLFALHGDPTVSTSARRAGLVTSPSVMPRSCRDSATVAAAGSHTTATP